MFTTSQNVHPHKEWTRVNIHISPKGEGNCVGIQLGEADGTYSISMHCAEGSPTVLLRKLYVAFTDLWMQVLEEEESK